ncbi:uncharacterized protein BO96DRAFT_325341 [Aspergillus niger CBS 101883]|uniref:Uncharacterized protein n=2 Tax=Aspergillus niger TaxID=5061 RepID=A2QE92_ASPNC|nr:uncharacterized protein BO96DRAFT_325341 [Aspergillus niger CBS 101883]XP_059600075.1 hypothetical protein An02g09850 [Aspergillus niger]PYH61711.1 hypothetical protein BO96DRAFT_325341 [Aspergillus niger CBS 101883]CAK37853.1 hypothetical protein An02g09850 [Aspergillus niger]
MIPAEAVGKSSGVIGRLTIPRNRHDCRIITAVSLRLYTNATNGGCSVKQPSGMGEGAKGWAAQLLTVKLIA